MQKTQAVVAVWRRVQIPEFLVEVSIPALLRDKRQKIDVSPSLALSPGTLPPDIYSARRAVYLAETECETENSFIAGLGRARTQVFVSFWRALVDVRLISVPTEQNSIRVAIRVINDSPAPAKVQSDYLDANLYAVRVAVAVPAGIHRPTIFQELPASFRYDRQMPGVGINAHVEAEQNGNLLKLTAESVPLTETPRLEAREFADAVPTFSALGSNPIPILESIAKHMADYDATQWERKLATLSGIERDDAERSRREFELEIGRFNKGLELLKNAKFPAVLQAFLLMNQAMGRANQSHSKWRLFQIAFIVSLLPELASREYPVLGSKDDGFVISFGSRQGVARPKPSWGLFFGRHFLIASEVNSSGIRLFFGSPWTFTFQQLQRLAGALAAAELVRKEKGLKGARFSIGYLVGGTVTPNKIDDDLHKRFTRQGLDPKYKRIFKCPFCGCRYQLPMSLVAAYRTSLRRPEVRGRKR